MRKLLVAAILASAVGSVQAQATLSGTLRLWTTNTATGTGGGINGVTNDAPSSFTIRATEDLGNGLQARAVIQTPIVGDSPNTGADTQLGSFQSTVGFANKLGSIDLGRQKHSVRLAMDAVDPYVVALFSTHNQIHAAQSSRTSNAVFTSVNVGAFTIKYDHGFSETPGVGANKSGSISGTFSNVRATVAFFNNDAVTQNSSTFYSLATTLPTKTFVAGSFSQDKTATTDANAWAVTAVHPVGKYDIKAVYGQRDLNKVTSFTGGVGYNFSKRTAVDLAYQKVESNIASNELRMVGVGITHRF